MEKFSKLKTDEQFEKLYKKAELCAELGCLDYLNGQKSRFTNGIRWYIAVTPKAGHAITWVAGEGFSEDPDQAEKVTSDGMNQALDKIIENCCSEIKEKQNLMTEYFAPELLF